MLFSFSKCCNYRLARRRRRFSFSGQQGNSVVVIEDNLEVIKTADGIIDLGPEGGDGGGEIVAAGTPEEVVRVKRSYTGQFLALARKPERKKRIEAAE